jgi:large subunit ribosomal protein L30
MERLKISQIKSSIDEPKRQKRTLQALGIKKMHRQIEVNATPQILGMINKIHHLLSVEKI